MVDNRAYGGQLVMTADDVEPQSLPAGIVLRIAMLPIANRPVK